MLCNQWIERAKDFMLPYPGVYQADNTRNTGSRFIVATAQTLSRRSKDHLRHVGLVIIDETHIIHKTHSKLLQLFDGELVLGLSATPMRRALGRLFESMVVGTSIGELIKLGHLVQPICYAPASGQITEALEGLSVAAGDYQQDQLAELMRRRVIISSVVPTWEKLGEGRPTIVFAVDKAHARDLSTEFVLAGHKSEVIVDDTSDEERAAIFARFDTGETTILCSVGVLAIGFDAPKAACAVLARPTKSVMLHIQQAGRVLRPFPGKTNAIIIDHASNCVRHMPPHVFVPPQDLNDLDLLEREGRKKRQAPGEYATCPACSFVYPRKQDICPQCGRARRPKATALTVNGQLARMGERPAPPPRRKLDELEIEGFYRQALFYVLEKAQKAGSAFHLTVARFKLVGDETRVIRREWSKLRPYKPTPEVYSWIVNERRRSAIAWRAMQERQQAAQPAPARRRRSPHPL